MKKIILLVTLLLYSTTTQAQTFLDWEFWWSGEESVPDVPYYQDALFVLNGEIITIGENKYFADQIGDRNFLITNYDFDPDWTVGFPYKSVATISAPPGDTILIQADVNNYFYAAADSTPNQIPVISLFQDVDYEHRLFTKHASQVVDTNGIETYEPRVLYIVLYKTTKANDSLIVCQTYYDVPREAVTNVKWVDGVNGLDTNPGTKAEPWKTINKAGSSATAGDTVYIKSAFYSENHNSSTTGDCRISKSCDYRGVGYVRVSSQPSAAQVIFVASGIEANLFGLYLNDTIPKMGIVYWSPTRRNASIVNCRIDNATNGYNADAVDTLIVRNSIIESNNQNYHSYGYLSIQSCLFKGSSGFISFGSAATFDSVIIQHNKIEGYLYIKGLSKAYVIDNILSRNDNCIYGVVANTTGHLLMQYNTVSGRISLGTAEKISYIQILDNQLIGIGDTQIAIGDCDSVKINRNIIANVAEGKYGKIIYTVSKGSPLIEIKNNYIVNRHPSEPPIMLGNESGENYDGIDSAIIAGNRVFGILDFIPDAVNSPHGVSVFNNSRVNITHNYITGQNIGILYKSDSLDSDGYSCSYNIVGNCNNGIGIKGSKNLLISNNTLNNCINGINFDNNLTIDVDGCVSKNNIVIDTSGTGALSHKLESPIVTSDNNLFFSENAQPFEINTFDKTIAEWQATGADVNSLFITSEQLSGLFTDYPDDFSLATGSVAIDAGEDLGDAYGDGLDASTTWGSSTTTPVIVTKQQDASWDIGAYVK